MPNNIENELCESGEEKSGLPVAAPALSAEPQRVSPTTPNAIPQPVRLDGTYECESASLTPAGSDCVATAEGGSDVQSRKIDANNEHVQLGLKCVYEVTARTPDGPIHATPMRKGSIPRGAPPDMITLLLLATALVALELC
ncbi:hypothetical protein IV203_027154 [Nitzschia inconspicua]|uniref:Uncharacterized protein n=1 Tax=Nitzschia inconspicua TaxID=303405 RepID=A0A9K3PXZ2_9STRA|nr:hypothetical protein IV203_027154 [Nitzschia inconspicua]